MTATKVSRKKNRRQRRAQHTQAKAFLLEVARRPSRIPLLATIALPVHTVNNHLSPPYLAFTNSTTPSMFSSFRDPKPPGTISTSMSVGAVSKVCVGTIDSLKLEPTAEDCALLVDTGSSVAAMILRFRVCVLCRGVGSRGRGGLRCFWVGGGESWWELLDWCYIFFSNISECVYLMEWRWFGNLELGPSYVLMLGL
jgi:hypothetical protein